MRDAYHTAGCAVEVLRLELGEQGGNGRVLAVPWADADPAISAGVDAYARIYSVDCAALAYPATSAARCRSRDLTVDDGGATTLSICQLALIEDGGGELDRFLASLIAQ